MCRLCSSAFFASLILFCLLLSGPPAAEADESSASAAGTSEGAPPAADETTNATPDDPIVEEDEIVVTGKLISDTLQETPESVAVWQADAIEDAGLQELQDIFNQTANAYQISNGEGFGIRGINHNSVGTGGAGELGSYYSDGVALTGFAKRFGPMQLWDVDQVEILRGPQATNVGRNALAGAVVLRTKDPVFDTESKWRIGSADENTTDFAGIFNTQIGSSSALRVTAERFETDGFVTNPTRGEDDFDARENLTLRAKYLIEPQSRDDLRFLITAQYAETERGNDIVDLSDPGARLNFSNLEDRETNDSLVLSTDLKWSLNDSWSLQSITSFLDSDYRRFDDDDQSAAGGGANRGRDSADRNWAQDLRFAYDRDDLRGVFGFYYTEVDVEGRSFGEVFLNPLELGIPAPLLAFYPESIGIDLDSPFLIETINFAAFTRWDWEIDDRWSVFGGFRWDSEQQDADQTTGTSLLTPLPDTAGLPLDLALTIQVINQALLGQLGETQAVTDTDYSAFLPEFGFGVDLRPNLTLNAFYRRGYRAGGAEVSLTGRLNEYDPETLDLVEVSLRSTALNDRLKVNANVYAGEWTDQQVNVQQSDNAFDFLTENVGESEIYGLELDGSYRATVGLDLYGSVGFSHTEFSEFESATLGNLEGNRFQLAPEWTAAFGITYRFGTGWFSHADINYQSESFSQVDNDPSLTAEERTVVNLRGGYETARYSILAYLENATDETYNVTAFRNSNGRILGKVGAPRQGGLQLILRF